MKVVRITYKNGEVELISDITSCDIKDNILRVMYEENEEFGPTNQWHKVIKRFYVNMDVVEKVETITGVELL